MRRLTHILLFLSLPICLWAQGHGLQIGPRMEVSLWPDAQLQHQPSVSAGLDLGYQCLWYAQRDCYVGLRTGLGFLYEHGEMSGRGLAQFDSHDYYGNRLCYSISAQLQQSQHRLLAELPLLFSSRLHGWAINIGPSLGVAFYEHYQQQLTETGIDVYYPAYEVTLHNEPSTGRFEQTSATGHTFAPALRLSLRAEIGYEFALHSRYSRDMEKYIGIQLLVGYGLLSYTPAGQQPLFYVAPITPATISPVVQIGHYAPSSAQAGHPFSLGIRLYYTFQTIDYPHHGWHSPRAHRSRIYLF